MKQTNSKDLKYSIIQSTTLLRVNIGSETNTRQVKTMKAILCDEVW